MFHYSFVGCPDTLATELATFLEDTGVNELMVTRHVFDVNAKIRSLEIAAGLF